MKKIFTLIAVAMISLTASAQLSFGLKGGLNVTNMSLSSEVLDSKNHAGFFIGPTVKFNLPVVNLGVDAAVLYDQREAKFTANVAGQTVVDDETVKRQAINIPINLRYGIGLGEMAEIFVKAGPQFGFNIGDKNPIKDYKDFTWKSSELSVNLGVGVMVMSHLEVAANYNIVCGKTGESSATDAISTAILKDSKNNAWQVSLAYYF